MTFIVLEGPDGAGKSRLQRELARHLRSRGHEPLELREPGSTPLGEHLRRLLLDPKVGHLDPLTEAFLFSGGRAEMVRSVIRPALAAGRIVLLDRWYWSTVAYQGGGGGVPLDLVEQMSLAATAGLRPDLVLLLDLAPEVAASRKGTPPDRMERHGRDYQERVRAAYATLGRRHRDIVRILDAAKPFEAVLAEARGHVEAIVPPRTPHP
jgi:dTMP kinase